MMKFMRLIATAALTGLTCTAAGAFTPQPFPRLAAVVFSSPQDYDNTALQAHLAQYQLVLISYWPGWHGTMTIGQSVANIKKINPNTLVFAYVISEAAPTTYGQDVWAGELSMLNQQHWWGYSAGSSGNIVPSFFGGGLVTVNNTLQSKPDANGNHFMDWFFGYAQANIFSQAPQLDGTFMDNVFWKPRVDADWNQDGVTDSQNDPAVQLWYRQGYRHWFDLAHAAMPGKYQLGNVTDWGTAGATLTPTAGAVDGGLIEAMLGQGYSPETWGGFQEMMRWYRQVMAATAQPQLTIFGQQGNPTDYQSFRYGFGASLLDNGYYNFTDISDIYYKNPWFDEFNVSLGNSVNSPATAAWSQGVYRRDYQNGIVLVNPKGNGAQTVKLETTYYRIKGTQAPSVNSGQATTSVTLQDRDGIILLRAQPIKQPQAPNSLEVHKG
jgi:hypothetical protein